MKLLVALAAAAVASSVASFANAAMSPDQRCSACLYTYQAIDREVTNQTSLYKGKKLSEQKAAAREILGTVCDDPTYFSNIGFANGRYVQTTDPLVTGEVDRAEHHAEDLAQMCRRLVTNNLKKLVTPLADFRKQSRIDLSKNLCSKWTDSCSFDYSKPARGKAGKTKISKSNKCLVDAIAKAVRGDFEGALEKVDCAVLEIPDASEDNGETGGEESQSSSSSSSSTNNNNNNDDDDEITVE
eukprot:INCI5679.1.p1 GENE.INCI5679.1~~INCI5679.1.p1  ORF type:complete len:242 (-),score=60.31 INCI5679.1:4-729(-)